MRPAFRGMEFILYPLRGRRQRAAPRSIPQIRIWLIQLFRSSVTVLKRNPISLIRALFSHLRSELILLRAPTAGASPKKFTRKQKSARVGNTATLSPEASSVGMVKTAERVNPSANKIYYDPRGQQRQTTYPDAQSAWTTGSESFLALPRFTFQGVSNR